MTQRNDRPLQNARLDTPYSDSERPAGSFVVRCTDKLLAQSAERQLCSSGAARQLTQSYVALVAPAAAAAAQHLQFYVAPCRRCTAASTTPTLRRHARQQTGKQANEQSDRQTDQQMYGGTDWTTLISDDASGCPPARGRHWSSRRLRPLVTENRPKSVVVAVAGDEEGEEEETMLNCWSCRYRETAGVLRSTAHDTPRPATLRPCLLYFRHYNHYYRRLSRQMATSTSVMYHWHLFDAIMFSTVYAIAWFLNVQLILIISFYVICWRHPRSTYEIKQTEWYFP